MDGVLRQPDGYWYPILDGVPSFLRGVLRGDLHAFQSRHGLAPVPDESTQRPEASEQAITNRTFSDKWRRFKNYGLEESHRPFPVRAGTRRSSDCRTSRR